MPALVAMPGASGAPNHLELVDHFVHGHSWSTTAGAANWRVATDNSGTFNIVDRVGGWAKLLPGTSANDYVSAQASGGAAAFALQANSNLSFFTVIETNDADDIKFFVGLASVDYATGATAGPVLDGTNDSIGFRNTAGNALAFNAVVEDDTNETVLTGVGSLADDTAIGLGIQIIGRSEVRFFVFNGSTSPIQVGRVTTNIPDEGALVTPTLEVSSPTGTTATYLLTDQCVVRQIPN